MSAAKDTAGLAEGVKADPPIHAERSEANVLNRGACCSLDTRSQTEGGRSGAFSSAARTVGQKPGRSRA